MLIVGDMTLRIQAMTEAEALKREASQEEISKMQLHLEEGLKAGALGLSTGISYSPLCIWLMFCFRIVVSSK